MLRVSSLANSGLATVWSANMGEAPEERHVYSGVDRQQKAPLGARCLRIMQWVSNVSLIVGNVVTLEKFDIFFVKRLAAMMIFLVVDVIYYGTEMGMGN